MENKKTIEQICIEHGLCTCDEAYTKRNMVAPDCPFHSMAVEEAVRCYANQRLDDAIGMAFEDEELGKSYVSIGAINSLKE